MCESAKIKKAPLVLILIVGLASRREHEAFADKRDLAVFPIFARSNKGGRSWGYASLVKSWIHSGDYLLITALHVVYEADSVDVYKLPDDQVPASTNLQSDGQPRPRPDKIATFGENSEILVWPAYELAAFPISAKTVSGTDLSTPSEKVLAAVRTLHLSASSIEETPAPASALFLFAQTDFDLDARYPIPMLGGGKFVPVGEHARSIAAHTERSEIEVLGAMASDRDTPLVLYSVPSMAGMSGAPVSTYVDGVPTILGIHIAGRTQQGTEAGEHATAGTAWAVCASAARTHQPISAKLGVDNTWPKYSKPQFRQGDEEYYPEELRDLALDDRRTRIELGISSSSSASLYGERTMSYAMHFDIDQFQQRDIFDSSVFVLGVELGYRYGTYGMRGAVRSVKGVSAGDQFVFCIPNRNCRGKASFSIIVNPLNFGYLHGTANAEESVDVATLGHELGIRGTMRSGHFQAFLSAQFGVEAALSFEHVWSPYTAMYGVSVGLEWTIKDWNLWLR